MKISDALLYIIYKNNNTMTSYELLNFMKQLQKYEMIEISEDDGISFSLTEKGLDKLVGIGLVKNKED